SSNGDFTAFSPFNFNGEDSFTYTISDGNGGTAEGTVTLNFEPVPDTPFANSDTAVTTVDTTVAIDVLANDTDPDEGDVLSILSFEQPQNGTVVQLPDSTLSYTPDSGFTGSDSFSYTITDTAGLTATNTVFLTVTQGGVNTPPVAADDSFTGIEHLQVPRNGLA